MPCPYAKISAGTVICSLEGDRVNPFIFPCLGAYKNCPRFKKVAVKPAEIKELLISVEKSLTEELEIVTSAKHFDPKISASIADMLYLATVYTEYNLLEHKVMNSDEILGYIDQIIKELKFSDMAVSVRPVDENEHYVVIRVLPDQKFGAAEVRTTGDIKPLKDLSELAGSLGVRKVKVSIYVKE